MAYAIEFGPSARREFRKLPIDVKKRLQEAIDRLAEDPRPVGCKALRGEESVLRIRVGPWRILYQVHDKQLVILVVRVGHRRKVYRS